MKLPYPLSTDAFHLIMAINCYFSIHLNNINHKTFLELWSNSKNISIVHSWEYVGRIPPSDMQRRSFLFKNINVVFYRFSFSVGNITQECSHTRKATKLWPQHFQETFSLNWQQIRFPQTSKQNTPQTSNHLSLQRCVPADNAGWDRSRKIKTFQDTGWQISYAKKVQVSKSSVSEVAAT